MNQLTPGDQALVRELRGQSENVLREVIGSAREVALLNVPNQRNAGDSLILQGELAYLRALGIRIRYLADLATYDADDLRRHLPAGPILMHGGGNFGDIWHGHQAHREQVARDFPGRRIVVLPQSIYYGSKERAAESDAVLGAHPDLTVLVRDTESLARAAEDLPSVRTAFCPDAALGWQPRRVAKADPGGRPRILLLARADREASSELTAVADDWIPDAALERADWEPLGAHRLRWRAARWIVRKDHDARTASGPRPIPRSVVDASLRAISDTNIASACTRYDGVALAVVDRLHAHILSALLGVPHVILDNSYGKVGAVHRDYTRGFSTAHYAVSLEEARSLAQEVLGRR